MRFLVSGLAAIRGQQPMFVMHVVECQKPEDIAVEYNSHEGHRFIMLNCWTVADDFELPETAGDEVSFTLGDM